MKINWSDINNLNVLYTRLLEEQQQEQPPSQEQAATTDADIAEMMRDGDELEQYEETDLPVFNYKKLALYLELCYDTKDPLLIYGEPGLGKSAIVQNFANIVAHNKGKEFVVWNKENPQRQREILQNPSQYFVLLDVRTAQLEPTDLVGIPHITSKEEYLETRQPKWVWLMSQENADGILFLDEINQGSPQVLKALYEVVLDRSAGGTKFAKDFAIVGAGNLGAQHGNDPIPPALTNRFSCGVLVADPDSWLDWAESNNIDKYIIAFVKSQPQLNFYTKPKNEDDPFPTPRAMQKLSTTLKHIYSRYHQAKKAGIKLHASIMTAIGDAAASKCGVDWARRFVQFVKYNLNFSPQNIIDTAHTFRGETDANKLAAVVHYMSGLVNTGIIKVKEVVDSINANGFNEKTQKLLEALASVIIHLPTEWSNIMMKQLKMQYPAEEMAIILKGLTYVGQRKPEIRPQMNQALEAIKEALKKD